MDVHKVIQNAEQVLSTIKTIVDDGTDPRWQAIIDIGEFVESDPLLVWEFTSRWGRHANEDLRGAIATCLLEHLMEYHFDLIFPLVEKVVRESKRFAFTFCMCGKFGQAKITSNAKRFDHLQKQL